MRDQLNDGLRLGYFNSTPPQPEAEVEVSQPVEPAEPASDVDHDMEDARAEREAERRD